MNSKLFGLQRLVVFPFMIGLLFMVVSCAKEPTPDENSATPAQFTSEKFAAVQIGQDWVSVQQSLGQPYGFYDVGKGRKRFTYSQAKDRTKEYMAYDVVVGPDGKVVDKSRFSLYAE